MGKIFALFNETFEVMNTAGDGFWGNRLFMFAFYTGLLVVFLGEKEKTKKLTVGGYSVIVLLALYNPVFFYACRIVFREIRLPYFRRLFSLLPVTYVISYAAVVLLGRLKGLKKMAVAAVLCVGIALRGNCIYREDWIKKSENVQKFSKDVIQVADAVHGTTEHVCLAVPSALSTYIRQYDASILMPYGRPQLIRPMLMSLLDCEEVNTEETLKYAGESACDYIAVYKNKQNRINLQNAGQTLFAETDHYLVYKLRDRNRVERELNEKKQIVRKTFLDEDGDPYESGGCATYRYTYDCYGNESRITYFDLNDQPKITSNGSCGFIKEWDYRPMLKEIVYIGIDEKPVMISSGYSAIHYSYDQKRRKTGEYYYDTDEKPVTIPAGYSGVRFAYNDLGQIERKIYVNEDGMPVCSNDGYAIDLLFYDTDSNVSGHKFMDEKGNPVLCRGGYSEIRFGFDDSRRVNREEYYGLDGKLIVLSDGSAVVEKEYDENGNITSLKYYDNFGKPVITNNGYARVIRKFNNNNKVIRDEYYDTDDRHFMLKDGFASQEYEYDSSENLIVNRYYDLDDNLVIINGGYAELQREYDEKGNAVVFRYFDVNGDPVTVKGGFAEIRRTYNNNRQVIREEYFDTAGNPVGIGEDKHIAVEKSYDDQGNEKDVFFY